MSGRGSTIYYRKDNHRVITAEDKYHMLMLHQYSKLSIGKIACKFSLDPIQVRIIIGKRSSGSCCG
jgi:hypothetical protein